MELDIIVVSEISQTEKDKCVLFHLDKKTGKCLWGANGGGRGTKKVPWGDMSKEHSL
jgi:hypothetical protein